MSDLANVSSLVEAAPQLPLSWYFDPRVHAAEMATLFARGPNYVGHELMVPNVGDYHVLDWMGKAKALVRNENGVELLSNVCRHRQALMLDGRGSAKNIVCPLHRWTYDLNGHLLGAPHFEGNPCLHLKKTPLQNWNGLLFDGQRDVSKDLAQLGVAGDFDFSGYMLDRVMIDEYDFNWKTFIEVYLEDYHVQPFHPGLGGFVELDDLKWEFSDWYNVQTVGVNRELSRPGTPKYREWHDKVLSYGNGKMPRYGAIWMLYYPNVMLEWYPNVLVVSTILPRDADHCTNVVEFYYPEDIVLFERDYIETEQKAYIETALEDEEICKRMHEGRRALYQLGIDEKGPYQSPMEDGLVHFHEFMRRELSAQVPLELRP